MGRLKAGTTARTAADSALSILLIEDDTRTADLIAASLAEAGWQVVRAADGADGYTSALGRPCDVMVVDRMLPHLDGLTLVRALRSEGRQTPVLFLTTMSGIDDRIEGLEAGGDDYLVKPFDHGELLARVKALARRSRIGSNSKCLRVADLEFDVVARRARRAGREIDLQPHELKLLECLVRQAGDVVTRRQLLEFAWDHGFVPRTNVVEAHMSRLRAKIDRGFGPELIVTVRGAGYVLRDPRA